MPRKRRKVVLLPGRCDGCNKCVEACSRAVNRGRKRGRRRDAVIRIIPDGSFFYPVFCRNCSDAPCVTACMTGCRMQGEDGIVTTDHERCVGCWMCIMNCPFGAIIRDGEDHLAYKCEGCTDSDTAPCVAACSMGLLSHKETLEFSASVRRESAERFVSGIVLV